MLCIPGLVRAVSRAFVHFEAVQLGHIEPIGNFTVLIVFSFSPRWYSCPVLSKSRSLYKILDVLFCSVVQDMFMDAHSTDE